MTMAPRGDSLAKLLIAERARPRIMWSSVRPISRKKRSITVPSNQAWVPWVIVS
ncbi:hypothetical protein D9M72_639080 [compost metagenome]